MIVDAPFGFEWVFAHAREAPDAPAIGTPSGWVTYGELAGMVRGLAAALERDGVGEGAFVLLALPPSPASVAATLAIQATGGCVVEINRELELSSVLSIARQIRATHAFVHGRDVARWSEVCKSSAIRNLRVVFPSAPSPAMGRALQGLRWYRVDENRPDADESGWVPGPIATRAPALVVFTSGSTGAPRGVVQTHGNLYANTVAIARFLGLKADDRALSILPLFYCYGRSVLQSHLLVGGSVYFDGRFMYPRVVMEAIAEQRCTGFYGVPHSFETLRRLVDVKALRLETLRYVAQAGGPMHADTIRWVREAFGPAPLFVMYGQTEATARLSYLPPDRADEKRGSIGRGLENVELRVVDPEGRELSPGEVGEVVARGPSITSGYLDAPEETAAILHDGWLWTGDLGWQDDEGFIFLTGRAKDILKLGGHRVSALEIERALLEHPSVLEAAVVGVSDATEGEVAVAWVTTREDADLDPQELRRFCRGMLPPFKVPREVRVVRELPRTASGKVSKSALREKVERDESVL